MVPSNLENKKKRVIIKDIENKTWKRNDDYLDEFEYLISAGVVLEVKAISKPSYPLSQNSGKNLLKLYLNDVGILSNIPLEIKSGKDYTVHSALDKFLSTDEYNIKELTCCPMSGMSTRKATLHIYRFIISCFLKTSRMLWNSF